MNSSKIRWVSLLPRGCGRIAALSVVLALSIPAIDSPSVLFAASGLSMLPMAPAGGDDDEFDDELRFQTVSRITLSFASDGTAISRYESSLYSSFGDLLTAQELEDTVLRAFQTWAQHSAINVGLVSDSGDPFGIGGLSQGDLRFGDVRVGAVPMAGDVFAVAVPNVDFVSGTWSGDLLFNSNAKFVDADQFFAVALHEAGHVLGLGHTTDATSVMHPTALNTVLNAADVADLKLLYGERLDLDQYDNVESGEDDNDSMNDAVEIRNTGSVDGIIPLLVFGDIENPTDIDFFSIEPNSGYIGSITFRLISEKVSLLNATMTLLDESGQVIESMSGNSNRGMDFSLQIDNVSDDEEYFVKIESNGNGNPDNQFGSYALVTTIDGNLQMGTELIDSIIRRNYGDLDQGDIQDLFLIEVLDDLHVNDTAATATILSPRENIALASIYRIQAGISDAIDVDFYQIQAFDSVMSVHVGAEEFRLISKIAVFDSSLQPITGETKVNGNGELLIEYSDLAIGADYFVSIAADRPDGEFGTGNYDLNIAYSGENRILDILGLGRVSPTHPTQVHSLYVARSQLFHFGLQYVDATVNPNATIWMSIYDEDGIVKYRVATRPGEVRTAKSVILRPGSYSIRVHLTNPPPAFSGAAANLPRFSRAWNYRVFGIGLSEPTGPEVIDPSEDPFSPCDKASSDFCYPNNRLSPNPFIFVVEDEVALPGPVTDPVWQNVNNWYWQVDWLG